MPQLSLNTTREIKYECLRDTEMNQKLIASILTNSVEQPHAKTSVSQPICMVRVKTASRGSFQL